VSSEALALVRRQLREQLRSRVDARGLASAPRTERRVRVREEALELLRASGAILPQRELTRMINEVSDDVVGFGPIEFLLKDPDVTEVMVNGSDDVYVEREGRIERAPDGLFEGEESVLHLIERIVGPLGLRVDESSPWADARLPDGSRVHAIVPPLSLRGPALTIRKFSPVPIQAGDLVAEAAWGRACSTSCQPRSAAARTSSSVVAPAVARPRCSGSSAGSSRRRAADHHRGCRRAPARETSRGLPRSAPGQRRREGPGERSRPGSQRAPHAADRIIVGEVRGGEALDMLQAMNTGHEGSLSTAHANSTRHLLWRLETMAMMSDVDLPAAHIRNQVASAIDLVVHLARRRDGRRVVWEVATVEGTHRGEPVVAPLFRFRPREGQFGAFEASGTVPQIASALTDRGEDVGDWLFAPGVDV
jgi:pilus assembly protein CpaF